MEDHGVGTRCEFFRRSEGPDGGPDDGPDSPQSAPEVGFLTHGLGLATTSMDLVQEMHVLRRWAKQRLHVRVRAVPHGGEALEEPRA